MTLDKIIGPLVTLIVFCAGYFFSRIDHIRERQRTIQNIKQLLFEEIKANYDKFARLVPTAQQLDDPNILGILVASLSELDFTVYDAYLSNISALPPLDVRIFYDAYRYMRKMRDSAVDLMNMFAKDQMAALLCSQPVLAMMKATLEALNRALLRFDGGEQFMNAARDDEKDWRPYLQLKKDMDAMVASFRMPPPAKASAKGATT